MWGYAILGPVEGAAYEDSRATSLATAGDLRDLLRSCSGDHTLSGGFCPEL
jgi:hypothetical protein